MDKRSADVVLVSMPWAPPAEPSLGLGILKSCLARADISSRVIHAAPWLLQWTQIDTYEFLADSWGVNEFLFTGELDEDFDEEQENRLIERARRYIGANRHPRFDTVESVCQLVLKMRHEIIPKFLDVCVEAVMERSPKLVGFTCLFDQTIASAALAKRLKVLAPDLQIIFGGYALEGPPGRTVAQAFPWIDQIILGDGEQAIVDIARSVLSGAKLKSEANHADVRIAQKIDMRDSPTPEYSDWLDELDDIAARNKVRITPHTFPVESSRGCWWGQHKHCVFCGIDEDAMIYRHKPAEQTLSMLREMRERYGDHRFRFSDYIMPKNYYLDLLPTLASEPVRFRLQSEIKANHPPERVKQLADAGFFELQPGIESFSTHVLKKMDKGVRAIDNVSLIKAGYNYKIIIDYNLLYGIPGEEAAAYEEMLTTVPRLYHLIPPISRNETVITRFAPLHSAPERFGIPAKPKHHPCYEVLFSAQFRERTGFDYVDYAYYFDRSFSYSERHEVLYSQLVLQIEHWKTQHRERFVELSYADDGDAIRIMDSRYDPDSTPYSLGTVAAEIYRRVNEAPTNVDNIRAALSRMQATSDRQWDDAIEELDEHRLLWWEGPLAIGLAIPAAIAAQHRESNWTKSWMSVLT